LIKVQTSILRVIFAYYIEPIYYLGIQIDLRIKGTLGITGLWILRVHINKFVWHLDVDSSRPGGEYSAKGSAVRRLKRYVSWVQSVVRQVGPYLLYHIHTL